MISLPDTASLLPQVFRCGNGTIHYFPAEGFPMVRLDLLHEAGSAYQPQPLCAAAANRLFVLASDSRSAAEVAEFMDYRGIVVESDPDQLVSRTTFYFLRRYLDDLLPGIDDLMRHPAFPQADFDVYRSKRRQEVLAMQQQSPKMARRLFYQSLFAKGHPLAVYAEADDADRLTRDVVRQFYAERYGSCHIVLSGDVDDELLRQVAPLQNETVPIDRKTLFGQSEATCSFAMPIAGAVQTTLRVGRVLPLRWDDPDYARLMLLVTLLGGYFGSRLMSNLREEMGVTYGVYARTQLYRGAIVFYINTDVAGGTADAAEQAIRHELRRLCDELVDDEELQRVKTVLVGDFIRSVDGVFERAQRFGQMWAADIDERLTDNMREAVATATASQLRELACRLLDPDRMVYCRAGA